MTTFLPTSKVRSGAGRLQFASRSGQVTMLPLMGMQRVYNLTGQMQALSMSLESQCRMSTEPHQRRLVPALRGRPASCV